MVWVLIDNTNGNEFVACGFVRSVVEEALKLLMEDDKMVGTHRMYTIKRIENNGEGYSKYFDEEYFHS